MFGFKRRATEREAKRTENLVVVRNAVRARLDDELREVIASVPMAHHTVTGTVEALAAKARSVREGFDAVLINGIDAYGPALAGADESVRAGAMVAQAVCNMATLTGTLDNPNTRGDIFFILGFTRDGSQLRDSIGGPNPATQPKTPSCDGIFASMHTTISRIIEEDRIKARTYLSEFEIGRSFAGTPAEKISVAREFVQNSKVGSAALRVWHATLYYHAWSKRGESQKWNDLGASEILEQSAFSLGQSDLLPRSTGFRWGDRSWIFTLEKTGRSFSGDNDLGKFRVTVDGELVMELAVAGFHREWGEEWYETDVSALTVGPWAGTLVDMWAALELAQQRRRAETETARVEEQASRIDLG